VAAIVFMGIIYLNHKKCKGTPGQAGDVKQLV
jgi:hypothetical protein